MWWNLLEQLIRRAECSKQLMSAPQNHYIFVAMTGLTKMTRKSGEKKSNKKGDCSRLFSPIMEHPLVWLRKDLNF